MTINGYAKASLRAQIRMFRKLWPVKAAEGINVIASAEVRAIWPELHTLRKFLDN